MGKRFFRGSALEAGKISLFVENIYANHESLGDRSSRGLFADRTGRRLRLERLSHPACETIRMEHSRSHIDVYHQHLRAGHSGVFRRPLAEPPWTAHRRVDRWCLVRTWRFPGQLFRSWIVVAVSELRRDWRNRLGIRLYRAGRRASEMVPGPQRIDYRHC